MAHPRLETLYRIITEARLDALALNPGAQLQYLTGHEFHLMERPLVVFFVPGQNPVAVVPALEAGRLEFGDIPFRLFPWNDTEGYHGAFAAAANLLKLNGKRLGVEELRLRVFESEIIRQHMPEAQICLAGEALVSLRLHKDASEIAAMREAIAISEAALQATIDAVRPGMTEREVGGLLVVEQLKRGGGKHPFEPIIGAGPNSALPHGEPGDDRVQPGQPLLFDFGTTVRGYASDITRTFSVGAPSQQLSDVYAAVKAANEAGRMAAKPGIPAQEVDRAARRVIEAAGYGQYFNHRTGHGLGLEPHEQPNMVEGNTMILEPGMVFTIEPGIYIPGAVGVRIEDNMVITESGAESLTTFPRDLIQIGQ